MTCRTPRPDAQALFNQHLGMFSSTVLGGAAVIPESNEWYVASLNYAMTEQFYSISDQQWRERDPRYACCENLTELAALDGVFPRAASFSEGYVKITGVAGGAIPDPLNFTIAGSDYTTVGTLPQVVPSSRQFTARIRSLEPGQGSNRLNGTTLATLTNGGIALDRQATIYGGNFCGGQDEEGCEEFRTRYLNRKQYQPKVNDSWIQQKLLEWPCATRVCRRDGACCDANISEDACDLCGKQFNYYVMFDGTFQCGLAPQCVIDQIQTWFFGNNDGYGEAIAPIGLCGQIYTAEPAVIDLYVNGAECITAAQKEEAQEVLEDLFMTFCPSQKVFLQQIEVVLAQVFGNTSNISVSATTQSDGVTLTYCAIEPDCDVMPCLGDIQYAAPLVGEGC